MKTLHLKPVLDFVRGVPLIPKRRTQLFREYKEVFEELTCCVPNTTGIYLWVGPNCHRIYRYVGISVEGFRKRFNGEFWQEYSAQWETVHGEDPTISLACRHYPKWIGKITSQSYRGKAGTEFILYHELKGRSKPDLRELEAEFIKFFHPVANKQRKAPTGRLHVNAIQLCREFETAVKDMIERR